MWEPLALLSGPAAHTARLRAAHSLQVMTPYWIPARSRRVSGLCFYLLDSVARQQEQVTPMA